MKKLSLKLLSDTVEIRRKEKKITQSELSKLTGINRALLSRLESQTFTPSVDQLLALAQILDININDLFTQTDDTDQSLDEPVKIAVAGTGYVGLSLAVLLAQHNDVTAVDIVPEKVEKIQRHHAWIARRRPADDADLGRPCRQGRFLPGRPLFGRFALAPQAGARDRRGLSGRCGEQRR